MAEVALSAHQCVFYFSDLNPSSSPACLPVGAVEMLPVYDSLSCVPRAQRGGVSDLTPGTASVLSKLTRPPCKCPVAFGGGGRWARAPFGAHKFGLVKESCRDAGIKVIRLQKHTRPRWLHGRPGAHKRPRGPGWVRWGRS